MPDSNGQHTAAQQFISWNERRGSSSHGRVGDQSGTTRNAQTARSLFRYGRCTVLVDLCQTGQRFERSNNETVSTDKASQEGRRQWARGARTNRSPHALAAVCLRFRESGRRQGNLHWAAGHSRKTLMAHGNRPTRVTWGSVSGSAPRVVKGGPRLRLRLRIAAASGACEQDVLHDTSSAPLATAPRARFPLQKTAKQIVFAGLRKLAGESSVEIKGTLCGTD